MEMSQTFKTTEIPAVFRNAPSLLDSVDIEVGEHVLFTPDVGKHEKLLNTLRASVSRFNKSSEDKKYIVRRLRDNRVGVYAVAPDDAALPAPRAPKAAKKAKKKN